MRNSWKFSYSVFEVLAGARAQLEYHNTRLVFWNKKREDILAKIKDDGIKIDESVIEKLAASGSTYSNFGLNNGPQVSVKQEYLEELNECNSKITQRRASVDQYTGWVKILETEGDSHRVLELEHDDWNFFFKS